MQIFLKISYFLPFSRILISIKSSEFYIFYFGVELPLSEFYFYYPNELVEILSIVIFISEDLKFVIDVEYFAPLSN